MLAIAHSDFETNQRHELSGVDGAFKIPKSKS